MFDLKLSQERAKQRLSRTSKRRPRADKGRSRLPEVVLAELRAAALGMDRPSMTALRRRLADVCAREKQRSPSRASLYNALPRIEGHTYEVSALPPHVIDALYNLTPGGSVPGHQLAFYCLNYGSPAAISFAAGLPWLDLYQASRLRGWRPRSRGLLDAVMRMRGI